MKRLTFDGNFCDIAQCAETRGGSFCEDGACSQRKVWERLKEWEDLEEQGRVIVMKNPEQDGMARLRELADADRDGRLVVLPCKVGDDVWFVRKFGKEQCIKRAEVSCINIDFRGEVFVSARRISGGYIGKTVFLTREEAEAALKGGEGL